MKAGDVCEAMGLVDQLNELSDYELDIRVYIRPKDSQRYVDPNGNRIMRYDINTQKVIEEMEGVVRKHIANRIMTIKAELRKLGVEV